ncbi:hypothetical protein PM082_022211 [Marasmius tenuissimus]|nr:hypothetical protein PM082_022211 [Marasmius tenuissimus]
MLGLSRNKFMNTSKTPTGPAIQVLWRFSLLTLGPFIGTRHLSIKLTGRVTVDTVVSVLPSRQFLFGIPSNIGTRGASLRSLDLRRHFSSFSERHLGVSVVTDRLRGGVDGTGRRNCRIRYLRRPLR